MAGVGSPARFDVAERARDHRCHGWTPAAYFGSLTCLRTAAEELADSRQAHMIGDERRE